MVSKAKMMKAYECMEEILKACRSEMNMDEYNGTIDKMVSEYVCFKEE